MAEHREVRYATPSLRRSRDAETRWYVDAHPHGNTIGFVEQDAAGWVAKTLANRTLGLFPHKQAAAEVLVKQAGYELGEVKQ